MPVPSTLPQPLSETDYEAIEAAVMETTRGRWFLTEYARRNRTADTRQILSAIERLENTVSGERASLGLERVRVDLMEMARAIARTKTEIAALRPNGEGIGQLEEATEALDAIVRTTERATSDILESAEAIQEAAWTLRETDADARLCDILDQRATDIYTACSFQDLTAQRTVKVVHALRYLEGRVAAMMRIWEDGNEHALPEEALPVVVDDMVEAPAHEPMGNALTQSDIDVVIIDPDLDAREALEAQQAADEVAFAENEPDPLDDTFEDGPAVLVDFDGGDLAFVPSEAEPASAPLVASGSPQFQLVETEDRRKQAFAAVDALPPVEKLKMFS
jgi:chemotaxis regulatin CheY-phosphate phosphatase CheZ